MNDEYDYGHNVSHYRSDVFISEGHDFNGRWIVNDTMNKRYTYSIDFLTYDTKHGKWDAIITRV